MWDSDRKRLSKWRQQMGYDQPEEEDAAAASAEEAAEPAVKVYFTRGCPHARAAMDLLREREIEFAEIDVKGDDATRSWLAIVTGNKTVPQIFINGAPIGGHDELRELDHSGKLSALLEGPPDPVGPIKDARGRVKLNVVQHPDHSPFEALDGDLGQALENELEGDALVEAVRNVLDECRPLVQADGGDIELLDVQGDVVHLQLTGNCIGCPSSQATLKQGIERRLKARIPQISGIQSPQLQPGA
jgi:Fe-S cluster biogenesis protein NfuA/glutaredoxin